MSKITFSIVSHRQLEKVKNLTNDILSLGLNNYEVIVVLNTKDEIINKYLDSGNKNIIVIQNISEKSYAQNHNFIFENSSGEYFIVLNPDVRLDNKSALFFESLDSLPEDIGVITGQEFDFNGNIRFNYRDFPTIKNLLKRRFFGKNTNKSMTIAGEYFYVDWVAGMLMCIRKNIFLRLKGFDEKYHMYCEDADICRRCNLIGYRVAVSNNFSFSHEGGFESRKKLKYFIIHLKSMLRFMIK